MRIRNRLFRPEIPLADLGPLVSVQSACCARLLSYFGGEREEIKFCIFSSADATIHSSMLLIGFLKEGTNIERYISIQYIQLTLT